MSEIPNNNTEQNKGEVNAENDYYSDDSDYIEGEILSKIDFIDLFRIVPSVPKNYWNMIKTNPIMFTKQSQNPENYKQFKFDPSGIFHESLQEKMQHNKFAQFAGDLKSRKWFYKDSTNTIKGPIDSEYINKYLIQAQIDENTKIAYQENEEVQQADLKFIKIKKFLEKN